MAALANLSPEPEEDDGIVLDVDQGIIEIIQPLSLKASRAVDYLSELVGGYKPALETLLEQGALGLETLKTSAHIVKLDEKIVELTTDLGEQSRTDREEILDKIGELLDRRDKLTIELVDKRNAEAAERHETLRKNALADLKVLLTDPESSELGKMKKDILDRLDKSDTTVTQAIAARQTELLKGSFAKGDAFEDVVAARLPVLARAMGGSVTYVGKTPGVKNADAGDFLLEVVTAAGPVTIAVEAKDHVSQKSAEAIRKSLKAASDNREADAAVFIAKSASILPKGMGFGQVDDCFFYCAFDPSAGDDAVLATTLYLAKMAAWECVRPTESSGVDMPVIVDQVEALRSLTELFAKIEASVGKAERENENIRTVAKRIREDMLRALTRLSEALGQ